MQTYNADFHIHGPYAGGTSKNLSVEKISEMGYYKGLNISPLGDLTHKSWSSDVFCKLQYENEEFFYDIKTIFGEKRMNFILSTEVQAKDRTHHLILFPDKETTLKFREKIKPFCNNMDGPMNGRPWLNLNAENIAKICVELDLVFGPAHAYTPYFGVYAHYNSLREAYGKYFDNLDFLELGLSCDSYLANNIEELKNISFLSNSDAHSFWPHRLGREFNILKLDKPNYYEIEKAFHKKNGRDLVLNAGLDPKEGMYHRTRCKNCLRFYDLDEAEKLNWKCVCKGLIKKGVLERIIEIAPKQQTYNRPEYKHILPLAEIIAFSLKSNNILSEKVQKIWWDFIKITETEINALLYFPESELEKINPEITNYILAFRKGFVSYFPGGAGQYGYPLIAFSDNEMKENNKKILEKIEEYKKNTSLTISQNQKKLFEF